MALSGQGNRGGVARKGDDLLSEEDATVRSGGALGVCRRYRCVVRGTESDRCEHRGSAGNKALGAAAIHGNGLGRKSLLFPQRLIPAKIGTKCDLTLR